MTATNQFGPSVGMAQIRDAVLDLARTWLPSYLADAAEGHGRARDWIAPPQTFEVADDVFEWPEALMPAFLPGISGTSGTPEARGDRTYCIDWYVTLGAIVAGTDAKDTEDQASIYGAAMRQMFLQQASQLVGLEVEGVILSPGEVYPTLPQKNSRFVLAPSVPFVLKLLEAAYGRRDVTTPPAPPVGSPGPYPTADIVTVTLTKD